MGFMSSSAPAPPPRPNEAEIARRAQELREKERAEAEKVREKERLELMKRKGRAKSVLTGPSGLLEEAPVKRKTLLGG